MRAGIQLAAVGDRVSKQDAGIIILRQHALARRETATRHAAGIHNGIIVMKHIAGIIQTELDAKLRAANGIIIIAAIYHVIISIIQTRQLARTILLICHVRGVRLTAIQQVAGIIIHNLFVKHKQNVCGKLLQAVAGAKN